MTSHKLILFQDVFLLLLLIYLGRCGMAGRLVDEPGRLGSAGRALTDPGRLGIGGAPGGGTLGGAVVGCCW